jgi:hypothetical protein
MFVVLYNTYRAESSEAKFEREAGELAELIQTLSDQDPGSTILFTLTVPQDCQLGFENTFVVVEIGSEVEHHDTSINLIGPSFSGGQVQLTLERTSEGVEISG